MAAFKNSGFFFTVEVFLCAVGAHCELLHLCGCCWLHIVTQERDPTARCALARADQVEGNCEDRRGSAVEVG